MWIVRSCKPGISYQVSTLQTAANKPLISDIILANRTVLYVQQTATRGLVFRPGLLWPSRETIKQHGNFPRICMAAVSDASHGGEDEWLDDWQEREAFRSQGAKLVFIPGVSIIVNNEAAVHLISFASTVQKRVVSSTMKAESYQLAEVVEAAD